MPALFPCVNAALDAGAAGAFLSGAGSSIMAITHGVHGEPLVQHAGERCDAEVADAMVAAAAAVGVTGKVYTVNPTTLGAHVVKVSGDSSKPASSRMRYRSTRSSSGVGTTGVTFEAAIMRGLAPDGGLYVPESIPIITPEEMKEWRALPFAALAVKIMSKFIGEDEIPPSSLEVTPPHCDMLSPPACLYGMCFLFRSTLTQPRHLSWHCCVCGIVVQVIVEKSYATFSTSHVTPLIKMSDDGSL